MGLCPTPQLCPPIPMLGLSQDTTLSTVLLPPALAGETPDSANHAAQIVLTALDFISRTWEHIFFFKIR